MADLSIQGLSKRFGASVAVEGFTLEIGDGEAVAVLGPSGCGKSTVMRMIAGIVASDSGTIRIGSRAVDDLPPERRNVGLVFQSYALFPHMTVEANIGFGLRMRGVQRQEIRRRVEQVLDLVALSALGGRYPRQLSGGQQQRVALARAVVIEPDVLLLDEPLSNLDAMLREQLREDLSALQRRLGVTMLYVTHDQSEAITIADRIVVMNGGRIQEIGSPIDLYQRPRRRFTAEFLGHTNLIPADVVDGGLRLPWGATISCADRDRSAGPTRSVSVRPEDIVLAAVDDGEGKVVQATFVGHGAEFKVEIGGYTLRARTAGIGGGMLSPGQRVSVRISGTPHSLDDPPT